MYFFYLNVFFLFKKKKEGSRKGSRRGSKKGSKRGVQKGGSTFCLHPKFCTFFFKKKAIGHFVILRLTGMVKQELICLNATIIA